MSWKKFLEHHPVLLAPMAGVTDPVMRALCIEQGASLTFTEMVSAKGLSYANQRTEDLLSLAEGEKQVGVQLFGHEPSMMAQEAARVRELLGDALAVIDINMGCPARKIVSKGDGSALMNTPDLAFDIARAVVQSVDVPVTVKFRRGYSLGEETAPEFARRLEQAGVAGMTVHGRYAAQMYRGQSDPMTIKRVVEAVRVPVVGNGDITSGEEARLMLERTGCSAIMIARAAQGNPWVFADIRAALTGDRSFTPPSFAERIEMCRRHARNLYAWEPLALVRMRKHGSWYCKGLPDAAILREMMMKAHTLDEFEQVCDEMHTRVRAAEEFSRAHGIYETK